MNARVLVPWKSIGDTLDDLSGLADGSLTVEVFTGDAPGPDDLGDVVFFTVPYDHPFSTEPIPRLSGVRVVQTLTAGYDHLAALLPGGITLCTARGLHDSSTAEHALGLILAAQRELPRWVRAQDEGCWEHAHTRSLANCRVLIVGYGSGIRSAAGVTKRSRVQPAQFKFAQLKCSNTPSPRHEPNSRPARCR